MSTQLVTDVENYDVNNMEFSKIQEHKVGLNSTITYKRINIYTKNKDGSVGDLILKTPNLFSFGVQESKSMDKQEVSGYSMPLCLWNRRGATEEENAWLATFNSICEYVKEYLLSIKDEFRCDLIASDLRKFNPLYWKRDKAGAVIPGNGPTLYPKLISSRRKGDEKEEDTFTFMTVLYDSNTEFEIHPLDILGKYCNVTAAIKIESIYIGGKNISLQVKLWEAEVSLQDSGVKRLLRATPSSRPVTDEVAENHNDYHNDNSGSLHPSDDDQYVVRPPSPMKMERMTSPPPQKKKGVAVKRK